MKWRWIKRHNVGLLSLVTNFTPTLCKVALRKMWLLAQTFNIFSTFFLEQNVVNFTKGRIHFLPWTILKPKSFASAFNVLLFRNVKQRIHPSDLLPYSGHILTVQGNLAFNSVDNLHSNNMRLNVVKLYFHRSAVTLLWTISFQRIALFKTFHLLWILNL